MTSAALEGDRPRSAAPLVAAVVGGVAGVTLVGGAVGFALGLSLVREQAAATLTISAVNAVHVMAVVQMLLTYPALYGAIRFAARSGPALSVARWVGVGAVAYGVAVLVGWGGLRAIVSALLFGLDGGPVPVLIPLYAIDGALWCSIAYLAASRAGARPPSLTAGLH